MPPPVCTPTCVGCHGWQQLKKFPDFVRYNSKLSEEKAANENVESHQLPLVAPSYFESHYLRQVAEYFNQLGICISFTNIPAFEARMDRESAGDKAQDIFVGYCSTLRCLLLGINYDAHGDVPAQRVVEIISVNQGKWIYRTHRHNPEQSLDEDDVVDATAMVSREEWFGGKHPSTGKYQTRVVNIMPDLYSGITRESDDDDGADQQQVIRRIFSYAPKTGIFNRLAHYRGSYKMLPSLDEKQLYFWINGRSLPYESM